MFYYYYFFPEEESRARVRQTEFRRWKCCKNKVRPIQAGETLEENELKERGERVVTFGGSEIKMNE